MRSSAPRSLSLVLLSLLACALAPTAAIGAPIGVVPNHSGQGHFSLQGQLSTDSTWLADSSCTGTTGCEARRVPFLTGGRLELLPLRGLGLFIEGAHVSEKIAEASYKGSGAVWGAGAHLTLPLKGRWALGLMAGAEQGQGQELGETESIDTTWTRGSGAITAILGSDDHGASLYFGPSWTFLFDHELTWSGADASSTGAVELERQSPIGLHLGGELSSGTLGAPWAEPRARLFAGAELRWDSGFGLSVWTGLRF